MIHHGDCLGHLREMKAESIDSLVTDPPAGIGFMGKGWDSDKGGRDQWISWLTEVMTECHRVLKPGAHALVWAIPRTSHWTMTALEDAGFEIRDVVTHLFGTGFPKSLNVGEGRGTALKPACEFWVLCRKPISEKTVAKNVLKWGTGALNIDASRIGWNNLGRFPSNLILDEEAAAALDDQSGFSKTPKSVTRNARKDTGKYGDYGAVTTQCAGDSGGASRFFYVPKASKADRGADNTHPTVKSTRLMSYLIRLITPPGGTVLDPFMGSGSTGVSAKAEGMKFVGIEVDSGYIIIAKKRLEA